MSFEKFISLQKSQFFWAQRKDSRYTCGNTNTLYLSGADPEKATFDTGNNKVITLSGLDGEIKSITIFKESYYADNIPGVWVHKGHIVAGPFAFGIQYENTVIDLPRTNYPVRTDLIECILPITTYSLPTLTATVITFAPISENGCERPRGAYTALMLKNTSNSNQQGKVLLPNTGHFSQIMDHADNAQIDIILSEDFSRERKVAFSLSPDETILIPVWIGVYGETPPPLLRYGIEYWLEQTLRYYRQLSGQLTFFDDPYLSEFWKRTLFQCQQSIGMDKDGNIAGSSWGTNPTTDQIWMKDMYYTLLPLSLSDPDLFRKGIEWFAKWGIRPSGTQFQGGVKHSLSNSLSAVMLAGMYYKRTGDISFFKENSSLVQRLRNILDEMISSREQEDIWLFPSTWISDGLAIGDFHTGSNITAWYALITFSRILNDIYNESTQADTYQKVADLVKNEILARCITKDGPFGEQLIEGIGKGSREFQEQMKANSEEEFRKKNSAFGIQFYEYYNREDNTPYLIHDGEETDTTLASFYNFLPWDFTALRNYTRFAMTEYNRFYCAESRGILWEDCTDSTFPGYVTGLANSHNHDTFLEFFTPFRELADLDGSIWWWPYPRNSKDNSLINRVPGKCGWSSGAVLSLMMHDLMGIDWDGADKNLSLQPLNIMGDFEWINAPFGNARFDISWQNSKLKVRNCNSFSVTVKILHPISDIPHSESIAIKEQRAPIQAQVTRRSFTILPRQSIAFII